jgi:CheY-specific phosphatase CheX
MIVDPAGEITADSRLIEAGVRSALVTFGQMLPRGSLVLKSQKFIHSSVAARTCLQQLRCNGVEVVLSLSGRISGTFTLALDNRAAQQLVTALAGEGATTPIFNEIARSVLKEAGNVVASAFLGTLESLSGSGGLPGLPDLHIGPPCHDEGSVEVVMYALPVMLIVGTSEEFAARGGIFISRHNERVEFPSPAS